MAARSARFLSDHRRAASARDHGGEAEFAASDSYLGRHDNHAWCRKFESALHHRTEIPQPCGISAPELARPGLEPGTPRFSVVRSRRSKDVEVPGTNRVYGPCPSNAKRRSLRSFPGRSGDEGRVISQSPRERSARSATESGCIVRRLARAGHVHPPGLLPSHVSGSYARGASPPCRARTERRYRARAPCFRDHGRRRGRSVR